ncbi:hypothetical protein ACFLQU_01930 [Verrucomicrobiota bacterium]
MNTYRTGYAAAFLALAVGLLLPGAARANTTNTTPFTNSFDQYASPPLTIVGVDGWYADDTNVLMVVTSPAALYGDYLGDLPITNGVGSSHTQILTLDGSGTNLFTNATFETYVDMMVQPKRWEEEDPPDVPTNDMRTAIYFNTNGRLVIYCSYHNAASNTDHAGWLETSGFTVGTSQWVRLTVDVVTGPPLVGDGTEWVRARLDGATLSSSLGAPIIGSTNNPGSWFQVAKTTPNHRLTGLGLSGTGKFDDMQFVTNDPISSVKYTVQITVNPAGSASASVGTFNTTDSATVPFKDSAPPFISVQTIPGDGSGYKITNILHKMGDGPETNAYNGFETFDWYQVEALPSNHTYKVYCEAQPQQLTIAGTGLPSTGNPVYGLHVNYVYDEVLNIQSTDSSPLSTATARHSCAWSRWGSDNASGESQGAPTAQTTFTLRGPTTNTWNWHTEYSLTARTASQRGAYTGTEGTLNVAKAPSKTWWNAGSTAVVVATPPTPVAGSWSFNSWSGDTADSAIISNQISLYMNNANTNLVANFIYTPNGSNWNLTVSSAYGSPTPAGTVSNIPDGAVTNCTVEQSIITANTQQYCIGWTGSGAAPSSGATTNTGLFVVTDDTTVTWNWQTRYKLMMGVINDGTTDPAAGDSWQNANSYVTLTATPDGGASFVGWTGTNTNDTVISTNQISVFMDAPRAVVATFTVGSVRTIAGTPHAWLDSHGLTNYAADDLLDPDTDGMLTWEEYIAGTDPTNGASYFHVLSMAEMPGSNRVTFYGTTNGSTNAFRIYRSTNLTVGAGWQLYSTKPRESDGTNEWWDATPPAGKVYYRPNAINTW